MTFPIKEESELSIHVAAAKRREAARWATLEMARLCARHHPELAQAWVERKREELELEAKPKPVVLVEANPVTRRYSRLSGHFVRILGRKPDGDDLRIPLTLDRRVKLIIAAVARKHGVSFAELVSVRRTRKFVVARQEAIWRLSKKLPLSLDQIGRRMNGRDHTTVLHSLRKHEERLAEGDRA